MGITEKLQGWARAAVQRLTRGPRILLYHRVAELESDPQWLAVTPQNFKGHLAVLSKTAEVVSLEEMHVLTAAGTLPRRAVAVTFDDGYADNESTAAPLLESARLPATFFVSSLCLRQQSELYWDELDRVMLGLRALPRYFELEVRGSLTRFDLGLEAETSNFERARGLQWNATMPTRSARQRAYLTLCGLLKPLDHDERERAIESLRATFGIEPGVRDSHRLMDESQLQRLADVPRITIGGHTVHHLMLSQHSLQLQEQEITLGKLDLERALGRQLSVFAYPYGGPDDFSADSKVIAHQAGYELACANYPGVAGASGDRYAWARQLVRDWTPEEFASRLNRWLGD
jgi:peptidoglycan/xylan/chitin deacetylase (PgdA/CDA1 family)